MLAEYFKGTGEITKLILRQNRLKIMIWLAGLVFVTLAAASAYIGVYKTEQDIMAFALTAENPAMIAMIGPGYELEEYGIPTIFANEMLLFTIIAVAVMNILLVGRATRADEEEGQMELILALPAGKLSYLTAGMMMALIINFLLTLFTGTGLYILDIDGMNLESCILYGTLLGTSGLVFAGFTGLFAQLAETSRGASGLSFAALIIAYVVRAIGDVGSEAIALISPLGWAVRSRVFVDNDWWPAAVSTVLFIGLVAVTFYLNSIRDMGGGFLPDRKGKVHANRLLKTPFGLAFRLQRTSFIAWSIGVFLLSAAFGSILGELETYFKDMEILQVYLESIPGTDMAEQFVIILMAIMSVISVIPVTQTIMRLKVEENRNRTELIYSRAVSRYKVLGSYMALAIVNSFILQSFIALGLWSAGKFVMEEALTFQSVFGSAYAYLPAVWLVTGLAVLFIGLKPKWSGLVWLYVVFCFLIVYLGDLLDLPKWVTDLSPFHHIPQIPVEEMDWPVMAVLTGGAILLICIGMAGYRNRDITG